MHLEPRRHSGAIGRLRRFAPAAAAAVLLAVLEAACGQAATTTITHANEHATNSGALTISVGGDTAAQAVPSSFMGISSEIKNLFAYAGTSPSSLDQPFVQLLKNLAPTGEPVLRLAGDSSDWSWWPTPGVATSPGFRFNLSPAWTSVAKSVATAIGGKLIVGLNFESDSRRVAAYEAQQLSARLGSSALAYELGNEPELYAAFGWYHTPSGKIVYGRPTTYTEDDYANDFANIASALGNVPVAGPSVGSPKWLAGIGAVLARNRSRLALVTVHAYPTKHCSSSTILHPSDLLSTASLQGVITALAPAVASAHAHRLPIRLDEINSVSCGGYLGVSNSFAAALWALNLLPMIDRAGISGVNFQTVPNTWQGMINAAHTSAGWKVTVQPVYYGLMTFAEAAPAGSHFLSVSAPAASGLWEWATRTPSGQVHVVITNSSSRARSTSIKITGETGFGEMTTLRASSINSTTGVTLGGQSLAASTGALAGAPASTSVTPTNSGSYALTVPASSAVVLTVGAGVTTPSTTTTTTPTATTTTAG